MQMASPPGRRGSQDFPAILNLRCEFGFAAWLSLAAANDGARGRFAYERLPASHRV
jgi:hypothetical protein